MRPAARLGAPLAASLALHAALLGAMGPGVREPALSQRAFTAMQIWLAGQRAAAAPAAPVPAQRAEAPLPFRGPSPTKYLTSRELDERATPIEVAPLLYPEKAYANRLAGTVRMRIYISRGGRVERTEIVAASPAGHFEQAAIDAVQRTRFRPARKGGRPVASQKLIEVQFDPYGPTPQERP